MKFNELNLLPEIEKALIAEGYEEATPIQEKAIPNVIKGGDFLGCAQTGTGKTAAFALPILQRIASDKTEVKGKRPIKSLVLAPTRELAIKITDSFKAYAINLPIRTLTIYGGVSQNPQVKELKKGVDILVATPGRLLDLIGQKHIDLKNVEYLVLDEADLMMDMGMLEDVKRILKFIPKERQTMFFSATMPKEIEKLSRTILNNPMKVTITPVSSTVDIIQQYLYYVDKGNKINLLVNLLKNDSIDSALVFSRTKHGANKIVTQLEKKGFSAEAIHGNKSQNARQKALANFKARKTRILVATDIAARGIDIDDLSHVINFDLPEVPETYVHRIGRTGRAGADGIAISFCSFQEKPLINDIQKLISKTIEVVDDHDFPLMDKTIKPKQQQGRGRNQGKRGSQSGSRRRTSGNKPKDVNKDGSAKKPSSSRRYAKRKSKKR